MSLVLLGVSTWLHSLATVVFIGHFVLLSILYVPALRDSPQDVRGGVLSAISRRSRFWLYGSLLIFAVTGTHLMLADPNYMGIGKFDNPWTMLMLVKHMLILGMLGMGFWFNAVQRIGPQASSNTGAERAFRQFRRYANGMAVTGALVLLLTAVAQAQ